MTIADTHTALAPVLTVEEAAQRLRIGRTWMYALIAAGDVESVRIGRYAVSRPMRLMTTSCVYAGSSRMRQRAPS